jgi:putative flippase GtrA
VAVQENVARPGVGGQAVRFLLVGGVATAVDVGLFNVLHVLGGLDSLAAKSISSVVAAVVAFVGNRQWSFPPGQGHGVGLRAQVIRYVAVNVAALGLSLAPIAVAQGALGLHGVVAMNIAANVVGLGLATAFRFLAYGRWVFPSRGREERPASGAVPALRAPDLRPGRVPGGRRTEGPGKRLLPGPS